MVDQGLKPECIRRGQVSGDDDVHGTTPPQLFQHRRGPLVEGRRNDDRRGAAVHQHVAPGVVGEERVERHRDDARLDGAPEGRRKVEPVEQDERHTLLRRDAEAAERGAEAIGPQLELGVCVLTGAVDERGPGAAALGHVTVHEVHGRVVRTSGMLPVHGSEGTSAACRSKR